jgi:predicted GNAT family N-acyltransferase
MNNDQITICFADWNNPDDKKNLSTIRRSVFIEEQKVPESLVWDEDDRHSKHYLVFYKDKAVAVARLKPDGQIGRMAVLPDYRNNGIGSALLQFILKIIETTSLKQVFLHAQTTAIKFYERQGFISHGDIFHEANIPHREMLKKLSNKLLSNNLLNNKL